MLIGLPADTTGLTCVDLDFGATGRAVRRASRRRSATATSRSSARRPRSTSGTPASPSGPWTDCAARAGELGLRVLHRPCEGGYDAMAVTLARILDERPGTTASSCRTSAAVEPLLALLRQQGRAVPEDVSVVAVCPDQVAVQASVRLTSVAIPAQEMGRRAVEQLVAKLAGRGGDEVVLLAPELTVRASTGPAPAP